MALTGQEVWDELKRLHVGIIEVDKDGNYLAVRPGRIVTDPETLEMEVVDLEHR